MYTCIYIYICRYSIRLSSSIVWQYLTISDVEKPSFLSSMKMSKLNFSYVLLHWPPLHVSKLLLYPHDMLRMWTIPQRVLLSSFNTVACYINALKSWGSCCFVNVHKLMCTPGKSCDGNLQALYQCWHKTSPRVWVSLQSVDGSDGS